MQRLDRAMAAGSEGPAAIRLTLWERIAILSPVRRAAVIALAIVLLAAAGLAAEEVVRGVIEGRPVEVKVKIGTEPPVILPSPTTPAAETPSTTGTAKTVMVAGTVTMSSSGGGKAFTPDQLEDLDALIAQKKYELIRTAETPLGTERFYRFIFSDGTAKDWPFYLPLEGVTSLDDYNEKHAAYEARRQAAMHKALAAGRYRLINVDLSPLHRCLDLATGKTIRVQKVVLPDGREMAVATEVQTPAIPPGATEFTETQYETTWQQHLDAIKAGRRKLLDAECVKSYWYEMTLEDGSKTIMSIGGDQPLPEKLPAAPKAP